jgi:predicted nucleotidyltransferase
MIERETIDKFASEIAQRFSPEKIILFGSWGRGQAYAGSDVDMLVVLDHDARRNVDMAIEILNALNPRFAIDLLVRKPADIAKRIAMNDCFIREIVEQGKVIYEGNHP